MNKIFKIVFNAARGKMMVVNEATSSVQTGKKAAVTVAVISALCSGVAMAANTVVTNGDISQFGTYSEADNVYTLTDAKLDTYTGDQSSRPINNEGGTTLKVLGGEFKNIQLGINNNSNRGGVIRSQYSDLIVDKVTFQNNKVVRVNGAKTYGPAIHQEGGKITVTNSHFVENSSEWMSGAINLSSTEATFIGNEFLKNKSPGGGAVMYANNVDATFSNNVFDGNEATGSEAGISLQGGTASFDGDIFSNNKALGGQAGALYVISGNVASFKNVTFENNSAKTKGGAIFIDSASTVNFVGTNTFSGNTAAGVANDIYNDGTINFAQGSFTYLAGGVSGNNLGSLAGYGSIVITSADATIGGQKTIADTLIFSATGSVNDKVAGDIKKLSEDVGVTISSMEEGSVMGAVTMKDGKVETQVNTKTEALAKQVTLAPQMITRIMMNDVRKRMGDLRAAEGTHGAWVRYNGGQMSGSGVEADFNMIQVGVDTVPVADAPRFGVAFSYAQTESEDVGGLASTDMDSFSLAFYGTKMYDNGMFVDVIGRMATTDAEMNVVGNKAKMDNVALSLSGELGWRLDVTDRFFFEPSVEATYTYTNADMFTMGNGKYELEAVDSLVGRAGFAAGMKCPGGHGDLYVRAAVVHEFMGDATMNSLVNGKSAAPFVADGKDTWFEYAIGANFNVNKNTYVYADLERTSGANVDEDWRANVGVRYAF